MLIYFSLAIFYLRYHYKRIIGLAIYGNERVRHINRIPVDINLVDRFVNDSLQTFQA